MRYAEKTTVTVEKSKGEMDSLLAKAGARQRALMNDEDKGLAVVMFSLQDRQVKLQMHFPTLPALRAQTKDDPPKGWLSWTEARRTEWLSDQLAQLERQRWRGLLLCVKAKLELIADGSSTLEREFLSDILLPDGRTVGETVSPLIKQAYLGGHVPPMLPEYGGKS